ncbi:ricin-type beta-trefoil lectin domain protein [Streptomyces sp. NPDC050636]|uniref:ricin-type beta-trefoil lectin domain protein n=1 Tax=Streptomyces sp. NPDC050636 TaxID=3154510 RepID=UPI003433E349
MSDLQQVDVMAGADSVATSGPGSGQEAVPWAELSDAALVLILRIPAIRVPTGRRVSAAERRISTEEIRARRKRIGKAAAELRRRHLPALLDYARLCGGAASAESLALEAFQSAVRDIRTAPGVEQPLRYDLLLHVPQTAVRWAAAGRREDLAPDFVAWLDEAARGGPGQSPAVRPWVDDSRVLRAFRRLPERARVVLWHAVVEHDDLAETSRFLGVQPRTVHLVGQRALEHLRRVCLQVHADHPDDEQCRRFGSLLEAATRRGGARASDDLDQHLAECPSCSRLRADLAAMNEHPDAVLAQALLPWGGAALVAGRRPRTHGRHAAAHAAHKTVSASGAGRLRSLAGRFPAASITAAVGLTVAAAALVPLPMTGGNTGSAAGPPPGDTSRSAPDARATATPAPAVSTTPEPRDPPSPRHSAEPAKSHAPSPRHSAPARPRPAPVHAHAKVRTYTELINGRSGLCLDVQGQFPQYGADVVARTCAGTPTQKWHVTGDGFIRNYADPGFCLDSGGSVHGWVGVWSCAFSADESEHDKQLFGRGPDGSLIPLANPVFPDRRFALTPSGESSGCGVGIAAVHSEPSQAWRTGAVASVPIT